MNPTDDDKFHDLLDFDLDDQRFVCWDILPPAPPDRLAAIRDAIVAGTWAGRIVVDELGRVVYGHDDYRAFRAVGKPPRHILQVRLGDRFDRAEVEGLIRLWRYCDGGLARVVGWRTLEDMPFVARCRVKRVYLSRRQVFEVVKVWGRMDAARGRPINDADKLPEPFRRVYLYAYRRELNEHQ